MAKKKKTPQKKSVKIRTKGGNIEHIRPNQVRKGDTVLKKTKKKK